MDNCLSGPKALVAFLAIPITQISFCQSASTVNVSKEAGIFKKSNLGIEVTTSILPGAKITRDQGNYKLRSSLQSSYDIGINYLYNINKKSLISAGVHIIVGKRNFFANIPSEDLPGFNGSGTRLIEDKGLWGSFRVPLLVEKKFHTAKMGVMSVKAGINLRYSGLMLDEGIGTTIIDQNGQTTHIFNAEFPAYKKPWITFLAGVSKQFVLRNYNIVSVCLQADISTRYFFKGNYAITIPNQPVTTGEYKINGTSAGLSVQYIFTGANKRLNRNYQNKKTYPAHTGTTRKKDIEKENLLSGQVFKGNHIRLDFAPLSTFRARLNNQSGDYPVGATRTRGWLLSFKYAINFNNYYSLITGAEATLAGRNLTTFFNKNDFSPPLIDDYWIGRKGMVTWDMLLSLPILMQKRMIYAKRKYVFAEAGIRLNFSTGADSDFSSIILMNTNNGYYDGGGWDVYANNDAKPWLSYPVNIGHAWLLKNNNLLQLAVCSNISFTKYVNGAYYIDIPGRPLIEGKYSSNGSYIGLSVNYIFTSANYRIRKDYEKKRRSQ
jgi:hypothetical protein